MKGPKVSVKRTHPATDNAKTINFTNSLNLSNPLYA